MLMKTEAFENSFKPGSLLSIYHFEIAPFLAWIGKNKKKNPSVVETYFASFH